MVAKYLKIGSPTFGKLDQKVSQKGNKIGSLKKFLSRKTLTKFKQI